MLLSYLLTAATIGFSAGVTPGPLQAVFLSYAVKGGWKQALPAAFAPLVSDGPVILLVLFVLRSMPASFIQILQVGGAFFLFYLAWDSLRAFRGYRAVSSAGDTSPWGTLIKATLMNVLAPGPWLFWSLINGPNLIKAWAISPGWGVGYLVSFYGSFILTNILLISLFSATRKLGEKIQKALLLVSAVALAGFGVYQLLQGVGVI